MTEGIKTIIYPVKDIAQAKTLYSKLLGVKPYMDEAYYVAFRCWRARRRFRSPWPQSRDDGARRLLAR